MRCVGLCCVGCGACGLVAAAARARSTPTFNKNVIQSKHSEFCAPLTSFDWNDADPLRLGTSSIDTTCTIWDVEVRGVGAFALCARALSRPCTKLNTQPQP